MEIIFIVISFIFIALAGVAEAVMDKLQFHFDRSIFANFRNKQWWDPINSWKNKWKNGDKTQGEKFWLSSTLFVFTTDAWHFFKFIRNISIFTTIFLILLVKSDFIDAFTMTLAFRVVYGALFYKNYNNFFEK